MTTTPRLGATDWAAAQASPWIAHNEALRRMEAGAGRYAVADRVTAPPGTCADGASYIIIATATGAFAGLEGQIATAVGANAASGWLYSVLGTIHEGVLAYVQDEDVDYRWSGSAWAAVSSSGATEASASEIWTGSETGKYVSPDKMFDAAAPTALTDAATIAVDMATGINFNVTLGGNRTLGNPTNAKAGQSGRIRVTQDGTGSRTLAYAANWKHVGSAPTIATAAAAVDLFAYFVNSSTDIELSYLGTLA